jgi:hypothetical protein
MARLLPQPCGVCGRPVRPGDRWVVGHTIPRWERPDLTWVASNLRHEHESCSASTGTREVQRKAYARGLAAAKGVRDSSPGRGGRERGSSQDGGPTDIPAVSVLSPTAPSSLPDEPQHEATDWRWITREIPWMEQFAAVPPDATPPRFMSGPHPRAVGTYGPDFVAWAGENPDLHARRTDGLRWFQRAIAYRMLEHDEAGSLVWRNVLITMARQCGKSHFLRALLMWRIQQEKRFGEEQTVISVAHKAQTAQEIFRPAARWAMARKDDGWVVRLSNGDVRIESPDGGRWLIQAATDGMGVGYSLSSIVADECWKIPRSVIEAADPALTEAESPQLMLISTAGDSSSDLFMTYRAQALETMLEPAGSFIAEWSAHPEHAPDDPEGWRAASPHWSARRAGEIEDKLGKLDPLEFKQNYMNLWVPVAHGRAAPGEPVFSESEWLDLAAPLDPADLRSPAVTAAESWFGEGIAVAHAYPQGDGIVLVSVTSHADARSAADAAREAGAPTLLVGKSLAADPAFIGLPVTPKGGTSRTAVQDLRRLVDEGALLHDGSETLADQVLGVRAAPSADGVRIRSTGRMDAIKCAVWAAEAARSVAETPAVY